jgi:Tol biopolymer transport system component
LATPQFSADGKRLFVVGRSYRGELVRYDIKSGQFVPFLGGVSGESSAFSKDRNWVAYVSYPEGTLWRSRLDGSDRRQLTFPPRYAYGPHWSPDGKQILYSEFGSDGQLKACLISAEGGSCKQVTPPDPNFQGDPNWSPDGTKIVFSGEFNDPETEIRILDLATNKVSTLPGSRGIFSPRWSPDGRYIAATSFDGSRVMLFDFVNQQWKELEKGIVGWPNWSKDGRYLYYLELGGTGSVRRVNIATSKIEQIANLKNFTTTGRFGISLVLAPDDSPLMLRNAGTQDIYSLDWEEP